LRGGGYYEIKFRHIPETPGRLSDEPRVNPRRPQPDKERGSRMTAQDIFTTARSKEAADATLARN